MIKNLSTEPRTVVRTGSNNPEKPAPKAAPKKAKKKVNRKKK